MKRPLTIFLLLLLVSSGITLTAQQVGTYLTRQGVRFEAITYAPSGFYYSLDYWTGNVYKIGPGDSVRTIVTGMSGPVGGAMDADGNFYYSELNTGKVFKVRPDDSYNEFASGFFGPTGMVLNPTQDTLYVNNYNNNTVKKLALADSSVHNFSGGNGIAGPDGIVLAPNGDLIVANFDDNRVHRINSSGIVSLFATLNGSPNSGYLVRLGQHYYITGFNGNRVYKIDSVGNVSVLAGTGMPGTLNGPASQAEFVRPNGICLNATQDTLLVTQGNVSGHLRYIVDFDLPTSVETPSDDGLGLECIPNPASDQSVIRVTLETPGAVRLDLYDVEGRLLRVLLEDELAAGVLEMPLEREGLAPGVYFCRLSAQGKVASEKFVVME